MAVPFRVKAIYDYTSSHDDDLKFDVGQVITVTEEEDNDWYVGEYVDDATGTKKEGLFPRNFVEKFEPTAPPRPTRTRKKEPEQALQVEQAAPPPPPPAPVDESESEPEEADEPAPAPKRNEPIVPVPVPVTAKAPAPAPKQAEAAAPAAVPKSKPAPPPVAEKPAPNSFKDRIAAFNKPAAPPVAPFKPTGLSSGGGGSGSGFIKKPFVAPPPSRNAYVPPARDKPPMANVYRREEDPEIKEQEAETRDQAEKAGLVSAGASEAADEADQPQPTSLKDRIALLQKQQMEQAQRHAEAATKKEKPKKPAKKRTEPTAAGDEASEAAEGPLSPSLERVETAETESRTSTDDARTSISSRAPPPPRRKASKGQALEESHDGNEADMSGAGDTTEGQDDTTEREDNEEASHRISRVPTSSTTATAGAAAAAERDEAEEEEEEEEEGGEDKDEEGDEEEEEEEEEVDPEMKRKEELRARMAKMSGGMGFHGMFGAPMPPAAKAPPKKKLSKPAETAPVDEADEEPVSRAAPPIPIPMALPGMGGAGAAGRSAREEDDEEDEEDDAEVTPVPSRPMPPPVPSGPATGRRDGEYEVEDEEATTPAAATQTTSPRRDISGPPPPIPGGRPLPPPVPTEARAPPPPPPSGLKSPTDGSESDDELSGGAREMDTERATSQAMRSPPMRPHGPQSPGLPPRSPVQSHGEDFSASSPSSTGKRTSRPPPPIPGSAPAPPPASSRPPPPPPPGSLSRQPTADANLATPTRPPQAGEEEDEEVTEYEGDYDTDIGSSVPHKDALKSHARDSSLEDNTLQSPIRGAPPSIPPPVPTGTAPRAIPPPVPSHAPPPETSRRSTEAPRAAPPPRPPPVPAKEPSAAKEDDEYDPYNYTSPTSSAPLGSSYGHKTPKIDEDGAYFAGAGGPASLATSPPPDRRAPPAAPAGRVPSGRPSTDLPRTSTGGNRRSLDTHRPSVESGFIANDVDLSVQSGWWRQPNQVPPVFQGRKDIHYESEESASTNQGSKTIVTRDMFILFQDYSQTVVTVRYDPHDPSDVELAQRHEPPPRPLRQDEMEEFYERFGRQISDAAGSKKDTVVGDGTAQGFIAELVRPLSGALVSVGTRSYGALVYANMANASTQQNDVIRAGDIISFRNAKFQGKHGAMHAKYSSEVGKPDHVAVVSEWDGTKKKVRAFEQGRENKKVKVESYKLDDLRSGEVKIWRVVPRSWVGWNIQP